MTYFPDCLSVVFFLALSILKSIDGWDRSLDHETIQFTKRGPDVFDSRVVCRGSIVIQMKKLSIGYDVESIAWKNQEEVTVWFQRNEGSV
jgi:hypothetical protein